MKLIVLILLGIVAYFILRKIFERKSLRRYKGFLTPGLVVFIFGVFVLSGLHDTYQPDKQCLFLHQTTSSPPRALVTAQDYLVQGDYDYDRGDCGKAISDYTTAITLDPNYAEAYNNRAYTYMRMRTYANALTDLDRALELRPNYINALMNRGDIYNFYYNIDKKKAIADYDKAIALGATQKNTSVCGHRELAVHGWHMAMFLMLTRNPSSPGCK